VRVFFFIFFPLRSLLFSFCLSCFFHDMNAQERKTGSQEVFYTDVSGSIQDILWAMRQAPGVAQNWWAYDYDGSGFALNARGGCVGHSPTPGAPTWLDIDSHTHHTRVRALLPLFSGLWPIVSSLFHLDSRARALGSSSHAGHGLWPSGSSPDLGSDL